MTCAVINENLNLHTWDEISKKSDKYNAVRNYSIYHDLLRKKASCSYEGRKASVTAFKEYTSSDIQERYFSNFVKLNETLQLEQKATYITGNTKYISDIVTLEEIFKAHTILLQSDQGTGKITLVEK
jgi:hypothetical protein